MGSIGSTVIAWMLVVAAALSLAAGTIAAIWQRRRSLSLLRAVAGHRPSELWRVVLLEAGFVGTGCVAASSRACSGISCSLAGSR